MTQVYWIGPARTSPRLPHREPPCSPYVLRGVVVLVVALIAASAASARPFPRIVNGTLTAEYPTVGAILYYADPQRTQLEGLCTGTLIGCRTFLTAAHCACAEEAEDADDCHRSGLVDRRTIQVYLPNAGLFDVERLAIDPNFKFTVRGDIAVFELTDTPRGILPSAINTLARPPLGTTGTLVGFGRTGGRESEKDDAGLKREGPVTTTPCEDDIPAATHICWRFSGIDASTCSGDSGGPLFIAGGDQLLVAGTTSGGTRETCLAPDFSFDTDVFVHRSFIFDEAQGDVLGERCDDAPVVGDEGVSVQHWTGEVGNVSSEARLQLDVPVGAGELRIGLAGQFVGGQGPFRVPNQFNLYVRAGAQPSRTVFDCAHEGPGVFGFCTITNPTPGTWHVLVDDVDGKGEWQVTATIFTQPAACVGDCDGDGVVTVDELVAGVNSALGAGAAVDCESLDANHDGVVTVDEIVTAVDHALQGCASL